MSAIALAQSTILRRILRLSTVGIVAGALPMYFGLRATGMHGMPASVAVLATASALLLLLERVIPRGGLGQRPPGTIGVDLFYTVMSGSLSNLLPAFVLVPIASAHVLHVGGAPLWPQALPFWVDFLLCTLLADFVSYWWHRLEHTPRFPLFWRLHAAHHAPRYFDFLMGAHVHPLDVVVFVCITAGLAGILGVPPATIEATMLFASVVGAAHHLDAECDAGWLNRLIPFADHHTVHHSRAAHENGNFGNITTIWDQLFGTYLPPRPFGPQPTGAWSLREDYPHDDLLAQLLSPFGRYWRRVTRIKPGER